MSEYDPEVLQNPSSFEPQADAVFSESEAAGFFDRLSPRARKVTKAAGVVAAGAFVASVGIGSALWADRSNPNIVGDATEFIIDGDVGCMNVEQATVDALRQDRLDWVVVERDRDTTTYDFDDTLFDVAFNHLDTVATVMERHGLTFVDPADELAALEEASSTADAFAIAAQYAARHDVQLKTVDYSADEYNDFLAKHGIRRFVTQQEFDAASISYFGSMIKTMALMPREETEYIGIGSIDFDVDLFALLDIDPTGRYYPFSHSLGIDLDNTYYQYFRTLAVVEDEKDWSRDDGYYVARAEGYGDRFHGTLLTEEFSHAFDREFCGLAGFVRDREWRDLPDSTRPVSTYLEDRESGAVEEDKATIAALASTDLLIEDTPRAHKLDVWRARQETAVPGLGFYYSELWTEIADIDFREKHDQKGGLGRRREATRD